MGRDLEPKESPDTGSEPAWTRLERLLADHYREQGYEVAAPAPSGHRRRGTAAFWLTLRRGDEHLLLMCRRDAHRPVTHQEVSNLLQAISRSGANGAILLTGGSFSTAARAVALRHEGLQLLDGEELHLLFNLGIVDALKQALELERGAAAVEGAGNAAPGGPTGAGPATPLPFYAEVAAAIREEDWAAEPAAPVARVAPPRRWLVAVLVVAVAALVGGWLHRSLETAAPPPDPAASDTVPSQASSISDEAPASPQPGPIHEQARQRVIALEGVTSAAWLPNGALLLGMRDTGRAEQERATRQACVILGEYPLLAGSTVEIQDTGPGEGRGLQVSCL